MVEVRLQTPLDLSTGELDAKEGSYITISRPRIPSSSPTPLSRCRKALSETSW